VAYYCTTAYKTILASLLRVAAGLFVAFIAAFATGVVIAISPLFSSVIDPWVLAPVAPIAWIPLGLAIFGVGNVAAVFLVFMGVVFVLTIATT
jgi:NitT/TauT family transport system permease protein